MDSQRSKGQIWDHYFPTALEAGVSEETPQGTLSHDFDLEAIPFSPNPPPPPRPVSYDVMWVSIVRQTGYAQSIWEQA